MVELDDQVAGLFYLIDDFELVLLWPATSLANSYLFCLDVAVSVGFSDVGVQLLSSMRARPIILMKDAKLSPLKEHTHPQKSHILRRKTLQNRITPHRTYQLRFTRISLTKQQNKVERIFPIRRGTPHSIRTTHEPVTVALQGVWMGLVFGDARVEFEQFYAVLV